MLNSPREKFLAILFGGSIAAVGLWETAGQVLLQPLTEARAAINAAQSANRTLLDQSNVVEHALRNLKQLNGHSLPADPGKASVLYQGWLIRHLQQSSIGSAIVTPAPAIVEKSIGHRIPFSIQCQASTANLAMFLDQFYATPLLHRITNLNIANSTDGEADHRVTISIEALAFDHATNIEALPDPGIVAEESSLLVAMSQDDIFRRKLPKQEFVPVVSSAPEPIPETPQPPKPDPRKSIRFVASVWNGDQREAWFFDQRSMEERSVVASSELTFPDVQGRILSIDGDTLQLELHGQRCRINLGQTLSDVSEVQ